MGSLEKRQIGAVSASVMGFVLLFSAVLLSLVDGGGVLTLVLGCIGGCTLTAGVCVNAHVSKAIIKDGRR